MKKISGLIIFLGFFIILGTAGTSDLEMETKKQIMSDAQFYIQLLTGFLLMALGCISILLYEVFQSVKTVKKIHIIKSKYSNCKNKYIEQ